MKRMSGSTTRRCDQVGVRILTIWFGDALLSPKTESTCAWVMPMLRDWVAEQSATV